jgi:hypothetical protein
MLGPPCVIVDQVGFYSSKFSSVGEANMSSNSGAMLGSCCPPGFILPAISVGVETDR